MISPQRAIADVKPDNALFWWDGSPQFDAPPEGNRIADGDMENPTTTAWTASNVVLTKELVTDGTGSRCLRITSNGVNSGGWAYQDARLIVGATYRVTGRARNGGTGYAAISDGTQRWIGAASTSWERFDFIFTAGGVIFYLGGKGFAPGAYVEFDTVMVELLSLASDCDSELIDASKWSVGNVAFITKPTSSPQAGTRCLRVAWNGTLKPYAYQSLANFYTYRVTGYARGDGTFAPKVMGGGGNEPWTGTSSTDWQAVDLTFTQNGTIIGFMSAASSMGYADFDNLAVLRTNEIIDGDMELGDTTNWTAMSSAVLTKVADGTAHGGTRFLKVAHNGVLNPYAKQTGAIVNGFTYTVSAWVRGDTVGYARLGFVGLGGAQNRADSTTAATWQFLTATGVCGDSATGVYLQAMTNTQGSYAGFDDVQLTLVKTTQDEDFELASTAKWLSGNSNSSTIVKVTSSPQAGTRCLRVSKGGAFDNPYMYQDALSGNVTARLTGFARGDGAITPRVINGSGVVVWQGTASTDWQAIDVTFTQPALATLIGFQAATSGAGSADFDSLVLLKTNELVDGDMEVADATCWTAAGGAVISKQTGTPHAGTRCLRLAGNIGALVYQSVAYAGFTYRYQAWMRSQDGVAVPSAFNYATTLWTGTTSTNWQAVDFTFVGSVGTGGNVGYSCGAVISTANGAVEIDDFTLTLVKTTQDEDMEGADTTKWTAANATLSKVSDGTQHGGTKFLRVTYSSGTGFYATQKCLCGGWTMRIRVWARGDGTRPPTVYAGTQLVWVGLPTASWQQCDVTVTVPGATGLIALKLGCEGAAGYVDFDDLTVTLVNLLADGDAELMDLSKWTATNALLSKTTTTPHGGTHALRVTGYGTAGFYATQACLYGGWTMRIRVWARGDGATAPTVYAGTQLIWTGSVLATWQQCDITLAIPGAAGAISLKLGSEAASGSVDFDDLQVDLVSLLADGDAELMDLSKWTPSLAIIRKATPGHAGTHCLEVVKVATNASVTNTVAPIIGATYVIAGWARGDGVAAPQLFDGVNPLWAGTSSTTWQFFRVTFTCTGVVAFYPVGALGGKIYIDDIAIVPLERVIENKGKAPGAIRLAKLGTGTACPQPIPGKRGLKFDGGDFVDTLLLDPFERTDKFTLFVVTSEVVGAAHDLISTIDKSKTYQGIGLQLLTYYRVYVINNYNTNRAEAYNVDLRTNGASSICGTYDGSSLSVGCNLYVNGAKIVTGSAASTLSATVKNGHTLLLGASYDGAAKYNLFTGNIHFAAVFPWELSPRQIRHLDRLVRYRLNV